MNHAFLNHFKISIQDATPAPGSLESELSLVELCLEKKLLDETSYLKWAKDFYGLCILKDEFLKENNQVKTLLNRYKNVFPKNIVPFYEWDGVIYVMCLEPVEFKAPQAIQYVLASNHLLQKFATLNDSKVQTDSAKTVVPESNEVTNPLFKNLADVKLATINSADLPNFQIDVTADTLESEQPLDEKNDGVPEGFNLKELSTEELVVAPEVPSLEGFVLEIPQGLSFPPSPSDKPEFAVDSKITADDLKLDLEDLPAEKESITKIFDIPLPNQISNGKQSPSVAATITPTIAPIIPETPPAIPVSAKVATPKASSAGVGVASTQLGNFQPLFDQMKKYFQQSMILSFRNNVLAPYKWDATWVKDPHSQSAIDISVPSIFRIVCETQKPYHGYVIPNSINDSFFTNWNQSKYPEHITVYPLVSGKQVVGMILGTCAKADAKSFQLHHIESLASQCAPLLVQSQLAA